jgi:hypothetical protein
LLPLFCACASRDKQYERVTGETAHDFKHAIVGDSAKVAQWDIARGSDGLLYLISKNGKVVIPTYEPWAG